jgi:predicted DNA-binding transcriptional regulator YafY
VFWESVSGTVFCRINFFLRRSLPDMAVNKLALLRYKTLDDCLRNRRRKWTLEDLIDKVGTVLYDREGIKAVSRRTIQADLQTLRSDTLGYNAPIEVVDKKYYRYSDPDYSITNAPINDADITKLKEIVGMLKQFNSFSYFEEMSEMIARLENNLHRQEGHSGSVIQFEENPLLRGREHLMPLYQAILKQQALLIEYQSFRAKGPQQAVYYPYLLKEYRNRWFLVAQPRKKGQLQTMALDRLIGFQELPNEPFVPYEGVPFDRYYSDLLGVTKGSGDRPQKVILDVDCATAPYVLTKPLHPSQQVLKTQDDGRILLRIDVVVNFELEREILGFGECVVVRSPRLLRGRILKKLQLAAEGYQEG